MIEGVMMRGPGKTVMAVRGTDGEISSKEVQSKSVSDRVKILKWPFLRGIVSMVESMALGMKCIMQSAEMAGIDLDDEEPSAFEKKLEKLFGDKLMKVVMGFASVLGVVLALGLFIVLPSVLFNIIENFADNKLENFRPLFEGGLKMIIFVCYLFVVSKMKEIHRVFEYHGAEHKTIFCYEAGDDLTVENVKKYKRFHPRCGTSFLLIVLILSLLISYILVALTDWNEYRYLWIGIKILMLPLLISLGYEVIKIAGRFDNPFTRVISAPGMWSQRLTTFEPDDQQIEVAIESLKLVIPENPDEDKW